MTQSELFSISPHGTVAPIVGRITQLTHEPLPPFARESETSRQAAIAKYDAHNSKNQRETIYRWIKFRGAQGATREEIADALDMSGDTVRPRVWELMGAGSKQGRAAAAITRNGKTRKTKSGMKAEVLIALVGL